MPIKHENEGEIKEGCSQPGIHISEFKCGSLIEIFSFLVNLLQFGLHGCCIEHGLKWYNQGYYLRTDICTKKIMTELLAKTRQMACN